MLMGGVHESFPPADCCGQHRESQRLERFKEHQTLQKHRKSTREEEEGEDQRGNWRSKNSAAAICYHNPVT